MFGGFIDMMANGGPGGLLQLIEGGINDAGKIKSMFGGNQQRQKPSEDELMQMVMGNPDMRSRLLRAMMNNGA